MTDLQAGEIRGLPATATRQLNRWLGDGATIRARCVGAYKIDELLLVIHDVDTPIPA